MDTPRFFWGWRIVRTASTFATGRATFRRAMARKVFLESKSRTHYSRVSRRLVILSELLLRHWSIRIWPLFFEVAPAFRKLVRNADSNGLPLKRRWAQQF